MRIFSLFGAGSCEANDKQAEEQNKTDEVAEVGLQFIYCTTSAFTEPL